MKKKGIYLKKNNNKKTQAVWEPVLCHLPVTFLRIHPKADLK